LGLPAVQARGHAVAAILKYIRTAETRRARELADYLILGNVSPRIV
jgi:hypothetical protein